MNCEQARASYLEEPNTHRSESDITTNRFSSILRDSLTSGKFGICVGQSVMHFTVCAAIQNGRAVGVTVTTDSLKRNEDCIASAIRRIGFPSNPKLDVSTARL